MRDEGLGSRVGGVEHHDDEEVEHVPRVRHEAPEPVSERIERKLNDEKLRSTHASNVIGSLV